MRTPECLDQRSNQRIGDSDSTQQSLLQQSLTEQRTLPIKRGEGYFQVLRRMNIDWTDERTTAEAHRIKSLNGKKDVLRVGEQLLIGRSDVPQVGEWSLIAAKVCTKPKEKRSEGADETKFELGVHLEVATFRKFRPPG